MMPVVFVGHGTPMNAIEDNEYTKGWKEISAAIPKPDAILAISAHWYTEGTRLLTTDHPKTIHDFYGFPKELFDIEYSAPGAPNLAHRTMELAGGAAFSDNTWGIDHGTWSVLRRMYPDADIPVCQMSIDQNLSPKESYQLGEKLKSLREKNILIFGSGNVVHNLGRVDFEAQGGFDWANEFDEYVKSSIEAKDFERVINYTKAGSCANYAFPTPEHFYPLLYVLGACDEKDKVTVYNNSCTMGSLSMTSYLFSE